MKKIKNLIEKIKVFYYKLITRFSKKKVELGTFAGGIKIDEDKLAKMLKERGL